MTHLPPDAADDFFLSDALAAESREAQQVSRLEEDHQDPRLSSEQRATLGPDLRAAHNASSVAQDDLNAALARSLGPREQALLIAMQRGLTSVMPSRGELNRLAEVGLLSLQKTGAFEMTPKGQRFAAERAQAFARYGSGRFEVDDRVQPVAQPQTGWGREFQAARCQAFVEYVGAYNGTGSLIKLRECGGKRTWEVWEYDLRTVT